MSMTVDCRMRIWRVKPGARRIVATRAAAAYLHAGRIFGQEARQCTRTFLSRPTARELSGKAIAHAIALAKALGAGLTAFYASPDYPLPVYAEERSFEPMSRTRVRGALQERGRQDPRRGRGQGEVGAGCVQCRAYHQFDAVARNSRRGPQASHAM